MTKISKTILVVDDSPVTQGLCRRMFENAGYAVIGALSGKGVPIIFMTNTISLKADKGYETFAIDGELFRAFAKPVHIPKILSAIRKEFNRTLHGGQPSPKLQDPQDDF